MAVEVKQMEEKQKAEAERCSATSVRRAEAGRGCDSQEENREKHHYHFSESELSDWILVNGESRWKFQHRTENVLIGIGGWSD